MQRSNVAGPVAAPFKSKAGCLSKAGFWVAGNAVCPGLIDIPMLQRFTGDSPEERAKVTEQVPAGADGKAEEIAEAVLWLCSDAASFAIGHALVVDGGQTV